MYAVIFKAKIKQLDEEYSSLAAKLRALAMQEFGCTEFSATSEGDMEIAISYWPSLDAIKQWKQASDHLYAQAQGRERWYSEYSVEVTEILRAYKR